MGRQKGSYLLRGLLSSFGTLGQPWMLKKMYHYCHYYHVIANENVRLGLMVSRIRTPCGVLPSMTRKFTTDMTFSITSFSWTSGRTMIKVNEKAAYRI